MKKQGIPLTRDNFIKFNFGELRDLDAEEEAELPEQFQNWKRFNKRSEAPAKSKARAYLNKTKPK